MAFRDENEKLKVKSMGDSKMKLVIFFNSKDIKRDSDELILKLKGKIKDKDEHYSEQIRKLEQREEAIRGK